MRPCRERCGASLTGWCSVSRASPPANRDTPGYPCLAACSMCAGGFSLNRSTVSSGIIERPTTVRLGSRFALMCCRSRPFETPGISAASFKGTCLAMRKYSLQAHMTSPMPGSSPLPQVAWCRVPPYSPIKLKWGRGMQWSSDGSCIASGSEDEAVPVCSARRAQTIMTIDRPNVVRMMAWSPDGKRIALAVYERRCISDRRG